MNLWAKSLKQLTFVSVALFFFSCQDDTSFIGLKNPSKKFEVFSVEIPLASSVITIDSVYTDNRGSIGSLLMGRYTDPIFGPVEAESYIQIGPTSSTKIDATSVFDSVTVELRYNYFSYGLSGTQSESFLIHEISDNAFATTNPVRFDATASLTYRPDAFVTVSQNIDPEEFSEQFALATTAQDTLIVSERLPDAFGLKIFDLAKEYAFSTSAEQLAFFQEVKGLALIPSETSQGIVGIRVDGFSRVILHYHSIENGAVKDTLSRNFNFTGASFSHISKDRSNTELSGITNSYQSYLENESDLRYLQSGNPILTRLDLEEFYNFLDEDSVKNILINEVRVIIDDVESPAATPAHQALALKLLNRNGYFFNRRVSSEYIEVEGNNRNVIPNSQGGDISYQHYFVGSEFSNSPAVLGYQSDENRYEGFATTFAQGLVRNRNLSNGEKNERRIKYLALFPVSPSLQYSVTRTVIPADQIKLKIYFTRPILSSN
jgi:hypothetical protein